MLSPFFYQDRPLHLDRFPPNQVNRDLQAWDSADELIIEHIEEERLLTANVKIAIFNDKFGALALALSAYSPQVYSDSFVSLEGIKYNAEINNIELETCQLNSCNHEISEIPTIVIIKVPKSRSLLQHQLNMLSKVVDENTVIVAGARVKELTPSVFKSFENNLGEVSTSLAKKKSRLLFIKPAKLTNKKSEVVNAWPLPDSNLSLVNYANVFARDKLDIGARFFLQHLPNFNESAKIIDLGCGNGVLGLVALQQNNKTTVAFVDESYLAIKSTKENIGNNLSESALKRCEFFVNDCLSGFEADSYDNIICNPPFHQAFAVTDHIAWQMFKESYHVLKKGGELTIVGNRQLGYHVKLKRIFKNCKTIASNKKFVILSAIKTA